MEEHLHILWTNADPVVFDKMVLMYAVNSLTHGWWEKVTVILWGESARLAVEDPAVARAHPPGPGAGRGILCLRFLRPRARGGGAAAGDGIGGHPLGRTADPPHPVPCPAAYRVKGNHIRPIPRQQYGNS